MESIFGALGALQQGETVDALSRRLGTDRDTTRQAISAALPALIGALGRNAASPEGSRALSGALDRDHDGGVLDDLVGALAGGDARAGEGILGHVFGTRRTSVESQLGRGAGVDAGTMAQVLAALAPVVLGALGREKRRQHWDADGLAGALAGERTRLRERDAGAASLFEQLVDRDGDGDTTDDLAAMGAKVLGSLFSR